MNSYVKWLAMLIEFANAKIDELPIDDIYGYELEEESELLERAITKLKFRLKLVNNEISERCSTVD